MKVSVQNHNKPLPFIGAAIQGLTNVLGAGISASQNAAQSERQMQHDIMMAQLNQQYNEENMETQNRYQIEQWERENAYNDPSAVAARYRNAGISPQAALGGSASGAGISGGLSSAPSGSGNMGSASSLPHVNSFADIGAGLSSAMRVDVQNKQDSVITEGKQIENKIKEIEAEYKETELVTQLQNLRSDIEVKKSKVRNNESLIKVYDARISEIDARINRMNKQNEESDAVIHKTKQDIKESDKRIENLSVETSREQNKLAFENKFNGAPMELLNTLPGASAFISYAVTNQVDKSFSQLVSDIKENKGNFPDPVRDFVKKYWNKFVPYLNKLDEKTTKNKVKSLPFVE